jgi:diacylglycerol kinase family enzyme
LSSKSHFVVMNGSAGTLTGQAINVDALRDRLRSLGEDVHLPDQDSPLDRQLEEAKQTSAPVLVAAGGDGTITAVAHTAIEAGKSLLILPLGTANLLARDLRLPLDLEAWFDAYPAMEPLQIDVGEVNGRIFLHKVVLGAIPSFAAAREKIRGRNDIGAKLSLLMYLFRRLSRLHRFAAEITRGSGDPRIERVQSIALANNDYDAAPGHIFSRSRLDGGFLSLYLLRHLGVADALRLAIEMVLGTWKDDESLEVDQVTEVTVRTRWRQVNAMVDGEVEKLQGPFNFRIRPRALTVLAPPVEKTLIESAEVSSAGKAA